MPPSNTAAWLTANDSPLEVKPAEYTSPGEHELVIKNGAVAVNPVDCGVQEHGQTLFPWLSYPVVLGADLAGEVVEVGSSVTRFKVGDRVLSISLGLMTNKPAEGAFQEYTVVSDILVSRIPDSMSYESASILPLCVTTAACGLFQKDCLALQYPSLEPKATGKTILIWGGASSVGCNAIQLAVAAGYEIITTASPKNTELLKRLGASEVFDYNSATVVEDLISALKDKDFAGALNTARGPAVKMCLDVVAKCPGTKFVAMAVQFDGKTPEGVQAKFYLGNDIEKSEVGPMVFSDFLPKALEEGKYEAAPDVQVVGKGLQFLQEALEILRKGVSAKKIVVTL